MIGRIHQSAAGSHVMPIRTNAQVPRVRDRERGGSGLGQSEIVNHLVNEVARRSFNLHQWRR
eukprot:9683347-Prorocentrum_lima.AAC.1